MGILRCHLVKQLVKLEERRALHAPVSSAPLFVYSQTHCDCTVMTKCIRREIAVASAA